MIPHNETISKGTNYEETHHPISPRIGKQTPHGFLYPLSSTLYPLSSILYPLSSVLFPLSSILYPLSSILYPPSSIPYPLSSILDETSNVIYYSPQTAMRLRHEVAIQMQPCIGWEMVGGLPAT